MSALFTPFRLGKLTLPNRIVMAPLTRNRAGAGNVPTELMATYYSQRAGAGLIVAEATQVCPEGQGYQSTPGIHSPEQIAGWKRVTDAVHARGGRIFLQLWHVGRVSHTALQPGGKAPVAPSAIRANTKTFVDGEFRDVSEPRALELSEIPGIIDAYRKGAANAIAAGFDGVEAHGANGYLLDQFLRDGSNKRTDEYGGSIENRARLMLEVMQAIAAEIGPERTGIRISPVTPANDAHDSNPQPLFNYVVEQLDRLNLVYIHIIEGQTGGDRNFGAGFDYGALRSRFRNAWLVNNGYSRQMAEEAVSGGRADLVAFGRPFISNPDLVERLRRNAPLTPPDRTTFYGGGAKGYTDYPVLEAAE
ncbi:MAG TPA: alkene reductase [Ferrovibrio sp.]|uniref:alkene reductase n=1 Tax=Ferrovibrio sp. TaxID=1917215 RepID=UPI002ED00559